MTGLGKKKKKFLIVDMFYIQNKERKKKYAPLCIIIV